MKDVSSFKKKLAGYSAMAGAVLAMNHPTSDAQVIYHDIVPDTFITDANPVYHLDMNNDGIIDFSLVNHGYGSIEFFWHNSNAAIASSFDFIYLVPISSCVNISQNPPSSEFFWTDYWPYGLGMMTTWNSFEAPWVFYGENKFAAVKLHLTDGDHYGWIRMSHTPGVDTLFIQSYAYEAIADSAILTGCPTPINTIPSPNLFNAFIEDHQLILHFPLSPLPSRIILFNDVGVKLNEQTITQSQLIIDVSNLAAGVYFVAVDDGEKRQVKKVVIE